MIDIINIQKELCLEIDKLQFFKESISYAILEDDYMEVIRLSSKCMEIQNKMKYYTLIVGEQ